MADTDVTIVTSLEELTDGENVMVDRAITRAFELARETVAVQERVQNNRKMLRLLDGEGELTEEQAAWLNAFYPEKRKGERRDKEDIALTRKVRAAAAGKEVADDDDGSDDE